MLPSLIVPPRYSEIETTDPDKVVAFFDSDVHSTVHSTHMAGGSSLRYSRADTGVFALADVCLPVEYAFSVEPVGELNISLRTSGIGERQTLGASGRCGPGDLYIAAQPDQPYTGWSGPAVSEPSILQLCYLAPVLLIQVAATEPTPRPGLVRFTSLEPLSQAAAACWNGARSHVAGLLDDPVAAAQPLLVGNAARLLAIAALATFPNTALTDPTSTDRHDASAATVRRATAFIEEHAHEDIAAADIAACAHVTIRAVQLAFRRHLGTSPIAYLRRVRLDRAHRQLLAADPARESVTSVAYRWGFTSPGRFAAYYRKAYGVLPSQTLRTDGAVIEHFPRQVNELTCQAACSLSAPVRSSSAW